MDMADELAKQPEAIDPVLNNAFKFFKGANLHNGNRSYFLIFRRQGEVRIGIGWSRAFAPATRVPGPVHDARYAIGDLTKEVIEGARSFVNPSCPTAFLLSGDLGRRWTFDDQKLALYVQPEAEVRFSSESPHGEVTYTTNADALSNANKLLHNRKSGTPSLRIPTISEAGSSALRNGWVSGETDDEFTMRIQACVRALQRYPKGKATMMRSYRREIARVAHSFDIFQMQAVLSGEYAFGHFICLGPDTFSFGCTPENTFEIDGNAINVDVIAATCPAERGDASVQAELTENPKQLKEHATTADVRAARYSSFCVNRELRPAFERTVLRLRHVCHLYTKLVGQVAPGVEHFDIARGLFPIMGARPAELISVSDSESSPNYFYGGMVGYLSPGESRYFLNIRNALVKENQLVAKAGMGVIRESDPVSELREAEQKLMGLMEAVYWAESLPQHLSA